MMKTFQRIRPSNVESTLPISCDVGLTTAMWSDVTSIHADAPTLWTWPSAPATVSPYRMLHTSISSFQQMCRCTSIPPHRTIISFECPVSFVGHCCPCHHVVAWHRGCNNWVVPLLPTYL
jgi:hypothetical protein